ncbi:MULTISPECIES: DUF488 domain-containing protein [Streptomyces]|uniref:DUF488 family protein n=1 Tax=Streptomyces katrae TaxID=68223 RepID=A0ABT7H2J3_9ACTN|nr:MULTISPECIES: DUF488 family protein [Streptomyces]MDK9500126.1 DUF488 family protein [Streptomyces katrae]RST02967.1 DUF488 family protein [Streptomyces sp. WAC07149]GLX18300.1 hypothetical protein Slala01_19440 [Streptomyces lavendulae subsp. lavendulae]GLX28774.1 hypothetical protein Slala02_45940 [Streptomyces lavendulae subsp. lavendulae]
MIRLRRVYDPPEPGADGVRVLVDRLWPRGLSKEAAAVDQWPRAVTPSAELRKWFHAGGSPQEFRARYEAELAAPGALDGLARLRELAAAGPLTLVTAVRDPDHSHAAVLAELLGGGAA